MKPQCPPEIVHKILLNFHRVDLLNSRLVSQIWNKESIRVLYNSGFVLDLNETNLGQFVQFSKLQSESSQTQPLLLLPVSLTLPFGNRPSEQSTVAEFKEIMSNVESLVELFGPKCVSGVKFNVYVDAQKLIPLALQLLTKVNKGLKNLSFTIYDEFDNDEDFFKNCGELVLPQIFDLSMHSKLNAQALFWSQLAEKCPNVLAMNTQSFSLNLSEDSWPNTSNLTKIKRLICTDLLNVSNKIRTNPWFGNLIWLEICIPRNISTDLLYFDNLKNIFEHVSQTLKGLDIVVQGSPYYQEDYTIQLPSIQFKRLAQLRVYFLDSRRMYPTLVIDPSSFPALEYVTLSYCMKVKILNGNCTEMDKDKDYDPFPKVKSLSLFVCEEVAMAPTEPYKNHMEALQNIFKHVTMITVSNHEQNSTYQRGQFGGGRIKYILEGIIQSEGSTKISQITLENCHENYLGIVLNQIYNPPRLVVENLPRNYLLDTTLKNAFEKLTGAINFLIIDENNTEDENEDGKTIVVQQCPVSLKMSNLKKIRLVLHSNDKTIWNSCIIPSNDNSINLMDTPRKLYMKTLIQSFPFLEEIQISSFMFGRDTKVRSQILEKIAKEYPNIVIDVI